MLKSFKHAGSASNQTNETKWPGNMGYSTNASAPAKATTDSPKADAPSSAGKQTSNGEDSQLIVGRNIKLKGSEITDCDVLVVEGRVEASMDSRDIRISEGGVFSGKAEVDLAEIRGTFEGELTVRKRLVVYATGRVIGTIRYGALTVEEGGTITGNLATYQAAPALAAVPDTPIQAHGG